MPPHVPAILGPRDAIVSLCEYRSSLLALDQAHMTIDTCLESDRFPALVVRTPVRHSPEFLEENPCALTLYETHGDSQELLATDCTMLDPRRKSGASRNLKFTMLSDRNNGHSRRDRVRNATGNDDCGSDSTDSAARSDVRPSDVFPASKRQRTDNSDGALQRITSFAASLAAEARGRATSGTDGQEHCQTESAETSTGGRGYSSTAARDTAAAAAAAAEAAAHGAPTCALLIEQPVALSPGAQTEADSTALDSLGGSSGGNGATYISFDQGTDSRSIDGLSSSSGISGGTACGISRGPAAAAAGVAAAAAVVPAAAPAAADACFMEAPGTPLLISAKAAPQQDGGAALGGTGQIEAGTGGGDSAASFSIVPPVSPTSPGGSSAACDAGATSVSPSRRGRKGYSRAPRASVAASQTAPVGAHLKTPGKVSSDTPPEDEHDRKIWTAGYIAAVDNARHERQQRGSVSAGRPRHSSSASASDEHVAQQFAAAVKEAQAQLLRADTRLMELQMRAPQNHHKRASNAVCVLRQQLIKTLADVNKMNKRCGALVSIVCTGPAETPGAMAALHTADNGSAIAATSAQAQEHHAAQKNEVMVMDINGCL
eukprot:TRINITY_DN9_c2_g1_i1.p1 TRINITY_DN9_c2_g1~~TRINITY_DN9_c2_g1_i1.p1  ORF type:complete len:602 (-),score=125.78 TRINITY_DN9_c2_g1_i1:1294-3099(-)